MTTAAERGRSNRNKGRAAEQQLARWLREHGFPHAERAVVTGWSTADRKRADPGDVTGIPGAVISVKYAQTERHATWRAELSDMLAGQDKPDALGLIVCRRPGKANPGDWWVWLSVTDMAALLGAPSYYGAQWFRTTVAELVPLMHLAGYGDEPAITAGEAS